MERKFEVQVTVGNDIVEGMLVTALEGGSNHWYLLGDTFMVIKNKKKALVENIFATIMTTKDKIPVHDVEEPEEVLGYITFENLQRGIDLLQKNYPEHFVDMVDEDYDAETADIWFQLAIMGEVTYC